jgi:A/G-specific adenine glycosylase
MSQQTRVETARPFYERFLAALPTVEALAAATPEHVLKLWEGLGYYTRARNLHRAAQGVVSERGGRFPVSVDEWRALPGVGPYTAAALASIANGIPAATVDGNVKRVLARLFQVTECIDDRATVARLDELAELLLARRAPGDFNQGMMELGARVCTPRRPACVNCPVRRWCGALAAGEAERLPVRRRKGAVPIVQAIGAVIEREGRWLVVRRAARGLLGGLWEFPSTELRNGDTAFAAITDHLRENLGIRFAMENELAAVRHVFTHRDLRLALVLGRHAGGRLRCRAYEEARWVTSAELADLPLSRLARKVEQAACG